MARSFDLVDNKLAEAEFFYRQLADEHCFLPEINWFLSAFASAARSVTYALQAVMSDVPKFRSWYEAKQKRLQDDQVSCFFLKLRNELIHIGSTPVNRGEIGQATELLQAMMRGKRTGRRFFFGSFDDPSLAPPSNDVVEMCEHYVKSLIQLVYDCYVDFGPVINPQQYYTAEHFESLGRTIEDAEEELIGVRGWTAAPGIPIEYRWQMLRRDQPGCRVDHVFEEYLGRTAPRPEWLASPCDT